MFICEQRKAENPNIWDATASKVSAYLLDNNGNKDFYISIATKLKFCCHLFVVCESIRSGLQLVWVQMNMIYSLVELMIVHEAEGVNKSPHLESARFALWAEQNDLIHAAWRNCLLDKRPEKSQYGYNFGPKWLSVP